MSQLVQTAILAGVAASLVSFVFLKIGRILEHRREQEEEESKAWRSVGEPVVHAADDLVGRLFDIMIRERSLRMEEQLSPEGFPLYDPPRELSTVWRLARYLAASIHLERHIADYGHVTNIGSLRFYSANKVRMALKGNLYRPDFRLQTEGQHVVGERILRLAPASDVDHLSFYNFLVGFLEEKEVQGVAEACRKFLVFNLDLDRLPGDFLTVSMTCVYLIDIVQDLRDSSKWEEFRIFLISVLKAHNERSARTPVYLYNRGDLTTDNYFDTFNYLPGDRVGQWWEWELLRAKSKADRREKRIKQRQSKDFGRTIEKAGVTRELRDGVIELRYDAAPEELLKQLRRAF